jgi:hypothetical protein
LVAITSSFNPVKANQRRHGPITAGDTREGIESLLTLVLVTSVPWLGASQRRPVIHGHP